MAFGVLKKVAKAFAGWLARWPKARSCVSVMMGGWSNARSHVSVMMGGWFNARSRVSVMMGGWSIARSRVSIMMGGWSNARSLCQHHDGWLARWPNARSLSASWRQCGSVNSDGNLSASWQQCGSVNSDGSQHHGGSVVVSTVMAVSNLGKMNAQFLLCSVWCAILQLLLGVIYATQGIHI